MMTQPFISLGMPSAVKDDRKLPGLMLLPVQPKRPEGRPTVMTPDVLKKLEVAFMYAFTDKEACLYAGISHTTLYNYQDAHPEFVERKEALKLTPNLAAKQTLVKNIEGNVDQSRWWATHQMEGFTPKSKVELSGKVETEDVGTTIELRKVVVEFEDKLRATIVEGRIKRP